MYQFTTDWTSDKRNSWLSALGHLRGIPNIRALEIGCWEGRSSCWFAQEILTGKDCVLDCVDPWSNPADGTEKRFDHNTQEFSGVVRKHKSASFAWLIHAHAAGAIEQYDFIYIDGDHSPQSVLDDLALAWPLLRPGGVLICDDYLYVEEEGRPQIAIDVFFACRSDWTLVEQGWQYLVRKNTNIEAVVVSVDYADYLIHTLPLLSRFVDLIAVVTSPSDEATAEVVRSNRYAKLVVTDSFYRNGAKFNKGTAINVGLKAISKANWVLLIDGDIALTRSIPIPKDHSAIWGARRQNLIGYERFLGELGKKDHPLKDAAPDYGIPIGFFQLWHWPTTPRWLPETSKDASTYDVEFSRMWPRSKQRWLDDFLVLHLLTNDSEFAVNYSGRRTRRFEVGPSKPRTFKPKPFREEYGLLTAANSSYWFTLRLLAESVVESEHSLAVIDHGLTPNQRKWLQHLGAKIIEFSLPENWIPEQSENPNFRSYIPVNAWLKPWLCGQSPFQRTIWIDSDAVILRDINRMFELVETGPWVTLENWITSESAKATYDAMIRSIFGSLPPRFENAHRVNSGVFGFHRGDAWIQAWWEVAQRILSTPEILGVSRLRDQGALVALLSDPNQTIRLPRIMLDRNLNWSANGASSSSRNLRKCYAWREPDVLEAIRRDHPNAAVVHWVGAPKPRQLS